MWYNHIFWINIVRRNGPLIIIDTTQDFFIQFFFYRKRYPYCFITTRNMNNNFTDLIYHVLLFMFNIVEQNPETNSLLIIRYIQQSEYIRVVIYNCNVNTIYTFHKMCLLIRNQIFT